MIGTANKYPFLLTQHRTMKQSLPLWPIFWVIAAEIAQKSEGFTIFFPVFARQQTEPEILLRRNWKYICDAFRKSANFMGNFQQGILAFPVLYLPCGYVAQDVF